LEHGALDGRDIVMKSKGLADDAGQVDNNPIVTGFGIVGKF
jgi:hypothetical protein